MLRARGGGVGHGTAATAIANDYLRCTSVGCYAARTYPQVVPRPWTEGRRVVVKCTTDHCAGLLRALRSETLRGGRWFPVAPIRVQLRWTCAHATARVARRGPVVRNGLSVVQRQGRGGATGRIASLPPKPSPCAPS